MPLAATLARPPVQPADDAPHLLLVDDEPALVLVVLDLDLCAQPHLVEAERLPFRRPPRGDDLGHDQRRGGVHPHERSLAVGALAIDDELVRQVLEHRPGAQADLHVLPRRALRMTVVIDEKGEGHAVLTLLTDRGDLVLDNKTSAVLPWHQTGYTFIKRESQDAIAWVSLGGLSSPATTANR